MKKSIPEIRFNGFNNEWQQCKLLDIVQLYNGLTYSLNDIVDSEGTLVLRSSNVKNDEVVDADNVYVKSDIINCENVKKDDIIVVVRNGSRALIGKHAQIKKVMPNTVIGAFMTGMRSEHPEFVNVLLSAPAFDHEVEKNMGATINQITNGMFAEMQFMIPMEEEQDRIGECFYNLDHLITLSQQKYDKLIATKKSMLDKMFPKKGYNVPEIRFKGFDEPWENLMFCDLFKERREKTEKENEDILLSCAINGIFLNTELFGHFRGTTTVGYLKVKKNDLILSAQNLHLGNANVNLRFEHGIISPAYKVYDIISCDPCFINTWLKKTDTKNFFLAATTEGASQCRKNIEWNTLDKQNIFVPSFKEQKLIGKYFFQLDNLITLQHQELEKLKNIKKSLLDKMFV